MEAKNFFASAQIFYAFRKQKDSRVQKETRYKIEKERPILEGNDLQNRNLVFKIFLYLNYPYW